MKRSFMHAFFPVLFCVFLLLSAVACAPINKQQPQMTYEEQVALYGDIISQYTDLITVKHNGEELPALNTDGMDEREAAIAEAVYGIVDRCRDASVVETLGYGYKDFDRNGIFEMVLLTRYNSPMAIFTISGKVPVLLVVGGSLSERLYFASQNRLLMLRHTVTDHIEEGVIYVCRIDGDKMIYDSVFGKVYNQETKELLEHFQIVDGNRTPIDEETSRALHREYQKAILPGYKTTSKLEAPRIYFPLEDSITDSELPVADFSSYAAIRETYRAMSICLEEFKSFDWTAGKYDNLFTFPSDLFYEYYNRLLIPAYSSGGYAGYDEIDLNGDGQDELVLMNEDYRIKAIFTQRNGIPVLLDAFTLSYQTCWLDDEGLIHVDSEEYDELKYSLYEFTESGEYKHHYSVISDNYGRYLIKDGKTEPISFEKSLKLYYDDYVRYSEPFEPNEHTRNVSDLTFTPLTEETGDPVGAAIGKTWYKYADLTKTSGSVYGAYSHTYVTLENAKETQIEANFRYVYTSHYPDPDRDHYLLNEEVESTLRVTCHKENGVLVFEEHGVKGRIELHHNFLWVIIEESEDQRFSVGNHCYGEDSPRE